MSSPRSGMPSRRLGLRRSLKAATAALGLLTAVGCQVEYAGMTLPSGKYMGDDVQYFAPGPAFPFANTQAASQRARMAAMGETPPPPGEATPIPLPSTSNPTPFRPAPVPDLNAAPGAVVPAPGGAVPAPVAPAPAPVPVPAPPPPGF